MNSEVLEGVGFLNGSNRYFAAIDKDCISDSSSNKGVIRVVPRLSRPLETLLFQGWDFFMTSIKNIRSANYDRIYSIKTITISL